MFKIHWLELKYNTIQIRSTFRKCIVLKELPPLFLISFITQKNVLPSFFKEIFIYNKEMDLHKFWVSNTKSFLVEHQKSHTTNTRNIKTSWHFISNLAKSKTQTTQLLKTMPTIMENPPTINIVESIGYENWREIPLLLQQNCPTKSEIWETLQLLVAIKRKKKFKKKVSLRFSVWVWTQSSETNS